MATVSLQHIDKIYDNKVQAVYDFNLDIKDGELIVLVGPSGCGKSTTLRMIAGLEDISNGHLFIDDKDVTRVPPKNRDIAMVFQNYALYPHMTVYGNMAFALKLRKIPCPVYKESPEAEALRQENLELIKKAKSLRKQSTKKKASPDLLPEASRLYDQILANHDKIVSMLSSGQEVGIYEEKGTFYNAFVEKVIVAGSSHADYFVCVLISIASKNTQVTAGNVIIRVNCTFHCNLLVC